MNDDLGRCADRVGLHIGGSQETSKIAHEINAEEILERCTCAMVDEGIAVRASDIDVV